MPHNPNMNRDIIVKCLKQAIGIVPRWTEDARNNLFGWLYLPHPDMLEPTAKALSEVGTRLCTITAYTESRHDPASRQSIAYHFAFYEIVITVNVPTYDQETEEILPVPSITPWFLNADWNEREFMEMYAITIKNQPTGKRLFLDERLDAGIMARLVPFSAMVHGAATRGLWEQVMAAKGIDISEEEHVSPYSDRVLTEMEDGTKEPVFTPVSATKPVKAGTQIDKEQAKASPATQKEAPDIADKKEAVPIKDGAEKTRKTVSSKGKDEKSAVSAKANTKKEKNSERAAIKSDTVAAKSNAAGKGYAPDKDAI